MNFSHLVEPETCCLHLAPKATSVARSRDRFLVKEGQRGI